MTREIFHHAASLLCPPPLQRRAMSSVHPHLAVARSPHPVSPVPQSRGRSVGPVPLPTPVPTLPVPWLQAPLQRPYRDPVAPEHTTAGVLDTRHLSVVPRLFVPAHRQGTGGPYPDQLSVVLVAA